MRAMIALLLFPLVVKAQTADTVTLQINPMTMIAFDQMTGLNKMGANLWNGTVRNDSGLTVKISWEDMQLSFPQVNFLTSMESSLLLTRKQRASFWTVVYTLLKDVMIGASVFASPWFLVAQPIFQQVDPQIAALQPSIGAFLAQTAVTSFTLGPGDKAVIVMLSGTMPKVDVHSYRHVMQVVDQPMVHPPALLRELSTTVQPAPLKLNLNAWIPPAALYGIEGE